MHALVWVALMLAAPYWEAKPARQWNDVELTEIFRDSPWAQVSTFREEAPMAMYIASAKPLRDAEGELLRRYTLKLGGTPPSELTARREYELFLQENLGKVIVVAVRDPNLKALAEEGEVKRMEETSYLKIGRKKIKLSGHFPPADSDPVLRYVFPRPDDLGKDLSFELYIPGLNGPYRTAVFRVKDLLFHGRIEL